MTPVTASRASRLADVWRKVRTSQIAYSFLHSPLTIVASMVLLVLVVAALLAPWIASQNTFDPAQINLLDSELPPAWRDGGDPRFLLGTDTQGRDMLSAIFFGLRMSLLVGFASVVFAMLIGVSLGLISAYAGGLIDTLIMRVADIMLTFPPILIALMVDGVARSVFPSNVHNEIALYVVIFAIGVSSWVQYARTVRASAMIEKSKEYVQSARLIGLSSFVIMIRHLLPNVMSPVLVIATINLAIAVLTEATLSFLGVGVPPTQPSLGTLIRIGNEYLFSGLWWITIFPSVALIVLVLSVNLVGDWLRDVLNPKLR
jgi:peptide/nickel transport system permease protein